MTTDIAVFLFQDGIVNASVYALLALALILIFSVTRIIYVAQGDTVTYAALTFTSLQQEIFPGVVYVVAVFGVMAAVYELVACVRQRMRPNAMRIGFYLAFPAALWMMVSSIDLAGLGAVGQILLTFAIVVPLGPMIYTTVFQPLARASVLVLLIAAVATHLVLQGCGLLVFGPDGARATPFDLGDIEIAGIMFTGQSLAVILTSLVLMILLATYFSVTLFGKALRATAVNPTGARLVGIRPDMAGRVCFTIATGVSTLSGILIAPLTTFYYDSGFIIGLRGFVAAIIGGLISYPLAIAGAVFVGVVESFASFWASEYREVIVFAVVIPVLIVRSLGTNVLAEEAE
ncbi:branched-chain amino acid ABC transporter permease [Aminobacter aminovorans]|uniref:ABC transporter permease n=1 Tax=Aminobacter aminovorans TaxID=83263 RepID=A0AAC8YVX3_AMIAI|nr:branched-chain amino acid ABC transporter permease [Aminobacter aminovorans]AMS45491.1 ABC transporter permease [Aminobacter aminovorans]MBB3708699.1 branched-chain amino acid transport system permease protein [Aminobacter aminovorans]